jgi:hypothetical protein
MAIRKLSDVNFMRLKKAFENELESRGHVLTQLDLHNKDTEVKLEFIIDNFYRHTFRWHSEGIIGKEFQEIVDEILQAFDHDKHLERNGKRI